MKNVVLTLVIIGLGGIFSVPPVYAHVLQSSGSVGAVLHILPSDAPVSGEPTVFELAFKDTSGQFLVSGCQCAVTVQNGDHILLRQNLTAINSQTAQGTVTFPAADVYTLKVTGTPAANARFTPFELSYLVRVEAGTTAGPTKANQRPLPLLLIAGLSLSLGLLLLEAFTASYDTKSKHRGKS